MLLGACACYRGVPYHQLSSIASLRRVNAKIKTFSVGRAYFVWEMIFIKRTLILLLASAILFAGCAKSVGSMDIKADDVSIFYGVSSYALFSKDQGVIDDLLGRFSSLTFEKTNKQMDLISAFSVNFSYKGKNVKRFTVDKNGVFWLDGETQTFKVSKGSFDYGHLKEVYENSKK